MCFRENGVAQCLRYHISRSLYLSIAQYIGCGHIIVLFQYSLLSARLSSTFSSASAVANKLFGIDSLVGNVLRLAIQFSKARQINIQLD